MSSDKIEIKVDKIIKICYFLFMCVHLNEVRSTEQFHMWETELDLLIPNIDYEQVNRNISYRELF